VAQDNEKIASNPNINEIVKENTLNLCVASAKMELLTFDKFDQHPFAVASFVHRPSLSKFSVLLAYTQSAQASFTLPPLSIEDRNITNTLLKCSEY